jgi:DNA-directed RNA polymerase subunit N
MIIPIRCFTCGKVLADKWRYYQERVEETSKADESTGAKESFKNVSQVQTGAILDELGLKRICCRRHMISHVDLVDVI